MFTYLVILDKNYFFGHRINARWRQNIYQRFIIDSEIDKSACSMQCQFFSTSGAPEKSH